MRSFIDERRPASRHIQGRKFTVFIDCERFRSNRSVRSGKRQAASTNNTTVLWTLIFPSYYRHNICVITLCEVIITLCEKSVTLCGHNMYYIMRKSYYVMQQLLCSAKNVLRYAIIITLCGNYYIMRHHMCSNVPQVGG